jgi:hypothetical protein
MLSLAYIFYAAGSQVGALVACRDPVLWAAPVFTHVLRPGDLPDIWSVNRSSDHWWHVHNACVDANSECITVQLIRISVVYEQRCSNKIGPSLYGVEGGSA